jgi:predicted phosphodiesterase
MHLDRPVGRRRFLEGVAAGALTGALSGVATPRARGQEAGSNANAGSLTRTPVSVMAPRADGFEAVWAVHGLCQGRIRWQAEDGTEGEAASDEFGFVPQGDRVLRVPVTGLRPGVRYRIQAVTRSSDGQREETGPWKSFRTLDPRAATTSFVVWNDTHLNQTTLERLHAVGPPADFLVWNGDTCNDWTSEALFVPTLLHPGGCDITEGRPLCLVWGNHDVRGPHAYAMPRVVATPGGRPFYAFRSGPVAAVFLHTGEDKPDSHPNFGGRVAFDGLRREQAEWLADVVKHPGMRDAPYRIVFCHIPLRWLDESVQDYDKTGFDRHSGRSRAAWHESLVRWRAQLVVSGHTHHPAWLPPTREFPYGQLVGGGPSPAGATWMEGTADATRLQVVVRGLDGAVKHAVRVRPGRRSRAEG